MSNETVENPVADADRNRDLRDQLGATEAQGDRPIVFTMTSTAGARTNLWSLENGAHMRLPKNMASALMRKKDPKGKYMFTATESLAPPYIEGMLPCFLNEDSPEFSIIQELQMPQRCRKHNLKNDESRRQHALRKHKGEWSTYTGYVDKMERDADRKLQADQVAATLELARAASANVPVVEPPKEKRANHYKPVSMECEFCGQECKGDLGLQSHMKKHREGNSDPRPGVLEFPDENGSFQGPIPDARYAGEDAHYQPESEPED